MGAMASHLHGNGQRAMHFKDHRYWTWGLWQATCMVMGSEPCLLDTMGYGHRGHGESPAI
eukprot:1016313-Pelagomonas_calceolata.AAC.3